MKMVLMGSSELASRIVDKHAAYSEVVVLTVSFANR